MRRLFFAFLALSFIFTGGCAKPDETLLKDAIRQYNKKLIIALKSDPEVLKDVAVERDRGRIQIYMTQMADENKIIDSQLKYINFRSIKVLNDKEWQELINQYRQRHERDSRVPNEGSLTEYKSGWALVKTEELWSYQYLDMRTKQKIDKPSLLRYSVTYIMVQEDNKWKIADVEFEETPAK